MLKRFLQYYKPHRTLFWLDMTASLLVAVLGIVYPVITRAMLNDLIPNQKWQGILFAGLALLLIYLLRGLLNFFIQYQGHDGCQNAGHDAKRSVFSFGKAPVFLF